MADPVSVLAIINGAIGLAMKCGEVGKGLNDLAGKYKKASITLLSLVGELETIDAAWSRIIEWSEENSDEASADTRLLQRLDRSLEVGGIVMSALQDDLSSYTQKVDRWRILQRTKVVWNETSLLNHQHRVRGQVGAMSLLLQALTL